MKGDMYTSQDGLIRLYNGNCADLFAPDEAGVYEFERAIEITDPPYGVTDHEWDTVVEASVWMFGRGCIAFAAEPYANHLLNTATLPFQHDEVWVKNCTSNHMNASRQPLRRHERVLVFGSPPYNPQMRARTAKELARLNKEQRKTMQLRNPDTVLDFESVNCRSGARTSHPSQKPIELVEYLVRTYSNPGDLIVDPFTGSGTTAIAVLRAGGRRFLGAELSVEFYDLAVARIIAGIEAILRGEEAA